MAEFEIGTGEEISQEDKSQDTEQSSATSNDEGADQQKSQAVDYSAELEQLRQQNASYQELSQRQMSEIMAFKNELASLRDDQRQRDLLLAGDKDALAARQEQMNQQKIKDEFFKIFPQAKNVLEQSGNSQPHVAELAYLNTAKSKGYEMAEKMGFKDPASKEFMVYAADMLIQNVPAWKQRFYQGGDLSVLDEVSKFINEKIFEPRDRAIKQSLISSIKKQNNLSTVMPKGGGGSAKPSKPERIDATRPEDRRKIYDHIYQRAVQGQEQDL